MTKGNQRTLTKVVYKPSTQSTEEYTVIVNHEEYQKYKEGGYSIPLVEVVDSFDVFFSNQGAQGILGKASNQQLENEFGSHKDIDVVEQILKKGVLQSGEGIRSGNSGTLNASLGSQSIDTRGKGPRG
ncbi:DUF1960-domain-containing protein [Cytidiella melzeri]|nr:DUF1960-domain-containing protein [Cytidiella melzeri]